MRQRYTFEVVINDEGDEHCETFNAMNEEHVRQLEDSVVEALEVINWEAQARLKTVEINLD